MRWYLAANQRAAELYKDHITVAIKSCFLNTSLEPRFVYSGADRNIARFVEDLGAEIVYHDVPFLDKLNSKKRIETRPHFKIEIASGAYLRSSVPLIEDRDDVVLYTDVDVMFLGDVKTPTFTEPFAASSEFTPGDRTYFNSGVMFMNVEKMRASYDDFVRYMADADFDYHGFDHYDQGAYNSYYKNHWSFIEEHYNWKPYLGINPRADIVHFHGPKIWTIRNMMDVGESPESPPLHVDLYRKDPDSYGKMREIFENLLIA